MWAITFVCLCVLMSFGDAADGVPRRDAEVFGYLFTLKL